MSNLDDQLKNLATTDWKQFMEVVGEGTLITAKARILRKNGKSYHQISVKLSLTQSQVRYACKDVKKTG